MLIDNQTYRKNVMCSLKILMPIQINRNQRMFYKTLLKMNNTNGGVMNVCVQITRNLMTPNLLSAPIVANKISVWLKLLKHIIMRFALYVMMASKNLLSIHVVIYAFAKKALKNIRKKNRKVIKHVPNALFASANIPISNRFLSEI